jgi:nucleotide-binding universal stress UspA family protein
LLDEQIFTQTNEMKSILVPVSFSDTSLNAARYAAGLAKASGAQVILLYVFQLPVSIAEASVSEGSFDRLQENYDAELKNLQAELAQQWGKGVPISIRLEVGNIEQQITAVCEELNPFMVVMGKSGNPLERTVLGSSTIFAVSHLRFPLLIVPGNARFHTIERIAFACDLSSTDAMPAGYFKDLQQTFHSAFDVVHVRTGNLGQAEGEPPEFELLRSKLQGISLTFHGIDKDNVEDGLRLFLANHQVDVLVVLPQKHDFLEFHRSHSKKMAIEATIPILSIRS